MHGSCVCAIGGFIPRSELGQNYVSFIVTEIKGSVCTYKVFIRDS